MYANYEVSITDSSKVIYPRIKLTSVVTLQTNKQTVRTTRGSRSHYCSPEYNKYFRFKLDFLANQKPWLPFWSPEKRKLGRGHWPLASSQVSLNSVQRFQRIFRKCLSQSEARAAILFFRSARKTQILWGRWDLASCQVSLTSVLKNVSANQSLRRPFWFSDRHEKHKLDRGHCDLASC